MFAESDIQQDFQTPLDFFPERSYSIKIFFREFVQIPCIK